jgi:hypothetical protein
MARFHLMHCIPSPRQHGLYGYKEVIDTVAWGLAELGHEPSYAVNAFDPKATNIIFGAQMLAVELLQKLPADSIVYSLEQARNVKPADMPVQVRYFAEHFEIWDYSPANLQAWRDLQAPRVKIVAVGYAPVLTRIPQAATQDLDVLIYGTTGANRLQALHELSHAGLTVLFVSGLYGEARDNLISRSKIVLNINLYDFAQIFEVVRVSYLFANSKAVVATRDPQTFVEADIGSGVLFTTLAHLVEDCRHLVEHDDARRALEAKGFDVITQRDIRTILRAALTARQESASCSAQ